MSKSNKWKWQGSKITDGKVKLSVNDLWDIRRLMVDIKGERGYMYSLKENKVARKQEKERLCN